LSIAIILETFYRKPFPDVVLPLILPKRGKLRQVFTVFYTGSEVGCMIHKLKRRRNKVLFFCYMAFAAFQFRESVQVCTVVFLYWEIDSDYLGTVAFQKPYI
jgi:hypothetical protein